MNTVVDILRGELERLFSLEELTSMSERLLGLLPDDVGGTAAKGSFARALTQRCAEGDRLEALVDVILVSSRDVDPRVRDLGALFAGEDAAAGATVGAFTIERKLGHSELATVYAAKRDGMRWALKVLRPAATRDRAAVQRFLTANRLVARVSHDGLPKHIEAGETSRGEAYVAYELVDGQLLSERVGRGGPLTFADAKPIARAILEALAALHDAQIIHGDLKLENILVAKDGQVVLVDFGIDRLIRRGALANGHTGLLAVYGSPKTVAPEVVRGKVPDTRSDIYAVGAVLYEVLTGKAPFEATEAADAALAHLVDEPVPASRRAPSGWVSPEIDRFLAALLAKDPARRPRDVRAVIASLDGMGRASGSMRAAAPMSASKVAELVAALAAEPADLEAALALEKALDSGADAAVVARAFADASQTTTGEAQKSLLYRAARTYDGHLDDKAAAEQLYAAVHALDPSDEVAQNALEAVRKALGKFEEIIEMLLERGQMAPPGEERARAFAEIGRVYARELDDAEQAAIAYVQALCEVPTDDSLASEIEHLCGTRQDRWQETLDSVAQALQANELQPSDRTALLLRAGKWYESRLGRADLSLMAYQQVLTAEPSNERAAEGLTAIYRRAQQWPELVALLLARADAAATGPRARDLRTEAAELVEGKLNDDVRARSLYDAVISEDPAHVRASEGLGRLAERTGDFRTLAEILARRAEASGVGDKADALARVAEVYEDHLNDLAESTRRYEAALAVDPGHLTSLKGLDRIFNRSGRYRELLDVLERQIQHAATPRQKINLFERMASLYDEEFLDHLSASRCLEEVLTIDATNDSAMTQLARHYRALDKWDRLVALYERHIAATTDDARKVELMLSRARVLSQEIGSPERAMKGLEEVLQLAPGNASALESLAQLREITGDAHAALTAIEALAAKATTAEARAEQWMRAARLLETRGDKDGAIERYKLALEANPRDPSAAVALRKAYALRGDVMSVVTLIEQELAHAENDLQRARLHAEVAKTYLYGVSDRERGALSAKRALELDATNADALMVLGDLAYDAGHMLEATKNYEMLVGRTGVLDKADAVRVLVRFLEAFGKSQRPSVPPPSMAAMSSGDLSGMSLPPPSMAPPAATNPRMVQAVEALQSLAPADVDAISRAANALFEFGDPKSAYRMHVDLFRNHGEELAGSERAEVLYHLGESARRSEELDAAIAPLVEACDLDPSNPRPFRSLARVYDAKEAWNESIEVRRRRLQLAAGAERFELLLEVGDILFAKLNDRANASKHYVAALEERPDDRKVLTKLMQLYSEEKDWAKLVDVVLRLADFVEEPKQRAKYMHTAATIASRQLGKTDDALAFYERALENDPTLVKALDEVAALYREKKRYDDVEKLLNRQLDLAKDAQDRDRIVKILGELAELYDRFLDEPALAIDAYEAAQAFEPDNKARQERLAELYASDPAQYLDKAVRAQSQILRRNPYRVESYKLLRKLYTDAKRADSAWTLCQALTVLKLADPDEERFFRKHRAENAAPAKAVLGDEDWTRLAHPDLDPNLQRIFELVQPTIQKARSQSLEALGFDTRYAIDPSKHPYAASQTLFYGQGVLGTSVPFVFQNPNDPGMVSVVHALTPAISLGKAAFEGSPETQKLAFVTGRVLTSFRPGFYVRHLIPTGTGLKAWLFAAIKMCVPQFPVAADLQGQVGEALASMAADFQGPARDQLASAVSKLLQAGGALDLKRWVGAVDLTADRVGFLLAHDLQVATEAIRSMNDGASLPVKERMKEIVLFGVSEEYMALRQRLQITITD